jgi:hypothetical protein
MMIFFEQKLKVIIFFFFMISSGIFPVAVLHGQNLSRTFEVRYFTSDPKANGETDFKGETEWMNTEERIVFLNEYADIASKYFNNPRLDKKIVTDAEINTLINSLKPQPENQIRNTISLNGWQSYGYKEGQDVATVNRIKLWEKHKGASVVNGELVLNNADVRKEIDPLTWRFKLESMIRFTDNSQVSFELKDKQKTAISVAINDRGILLNNKNQSKKVSLNRKEGSKLLIEGDLTRKKFNCYIDNELILDFTLMADTTIQSISGLNIISSGNVFLDDVFLFNHTPLDSRNYPYSSQVILDENFEPKIGPQGWQTLQFDDSHWKVADLPAVHGGIREAEENFYLRKKAFAGDFERAFLQIETLDPGGEIWVNNQVVAVINDRHPHEIEITDYLKNNQENLFAVKVKPYKLNFPMPHTPTDHNIGWFLGRTKLELTSKCVIKSVAVTTNKLEKNAVQSHKVSIHYPDREFFEGSIEINYYPWFPNEGNRIASFTSEIKVRPRVENEFVFDFPVENPVPWSPDSPHLYKVETILKDKDGNPVDDLVVTTGIRTIRQADGHLYINGKPEMLNGAQIMGFRTPIETIAKYNRCAPIETVAEEMLMIKKMDANLLRVHVHAEKDTADGINDARYAEFADQMGIYLIWSTAAFIREGEAWNIDFEGYPKFMKQVINHPSIVIWEASNHPNRFKLHDISETHDFVRNIYQTIYNADQSRLISPTTAWGHTHYANYDGTLDYEGNAITPVPEYMADLVTRGSQDAYTGYGAEWSKLRTAPTGFAASCLAANDKAYFNFEHEESIGQPNWELSRGKPWYLIHSYEWGYDEGSIGRLLTSDEWRASQAFQAFGAWEAMKKQMLIGYDGFSWCTIRGGANMGTYQKPLIDNLRHPKLAWYANKMVFQRTWAASNNVDVVYGPDDWIAPVIHHIGDRKKVDLVIELQNSKGKVLETKSFRNLDLQEGRSSLQLEKFRFKKSYEGIYSVHYTLTDK